MGDGTLETPETPGTAGTAEVVTDRIVTIPNAITMVRLLCLPVFLWLLFGRDNREAAAWTLVAIGSTDWLDGYLARRLQQVSTVGKVLDPVADRLWFFIGAGAILVDGTVPAWFAVAVLAREVLVSVATLVLAALGGRRVDVTMAGKTATFLLMGAFPAFLLSESAAGYADLFRPLAWGAGIPGLVLSYYAAALYVPIARRALAEGRTGRGVDRVKAVIMAGGEGTRLRPLTANVPKPMLPLVNRPIMAHIIDLLREHGIHEIVVTLAYLGNQIRTYFGDGDDHGVNIVYATEDQPLGTAGSVRNARDQLDERFLVISGDVVTDVDLGKLIGLHEEKSALATLGLVEVDNPLDFGIVITRDDGSIERFLEKPTWGQVFSDTVNAGIFVLEPEVLDAVDDSRPVDFSGEVFPALLARDAPLYGSVLEGYWEDVGTLDVYAAAHMDALDGKVRLDIDGFAQRPDLWVGRGVQVDASARIEGPVVIGDHCRIDGDARLGRYTVLGSNVRVRGGADLERSIVGDNCYIGEGVRLSGAVLSRACDVRRHARCEEGAVLGDECFVGEHAVIGSAVKIYPFKTVESGAVVHTSLVWESRGARSLFRERGVVGLANVDITPEVAARVAMAFSTTLDQGVQIVMSRDLSRSARMLKRAMMAGVNATGVDVLDLEVASLPVTRFQTRRPKQRGGVSIRLDPDDAESVIIRFLADDGTDVSDATLRRIERQLVREDFRRVLASEIGDISFPPRALEHYSVALEATIDAARIRQREFRLVVDYAYGATSFVMPQVLAKLGAQVLAVNPYAATGRMIRFDHPDAAREVARLVETSRADLGVILDADGERLTVVDDSGRVLADDVLLLVLASLAAGAADAGVLAVPVQVSEAIREVVGPDIDIRRTKRSDGALLRAATEPGVVFAGNDGARFVIPDAGWAFDAAAALVHLLGWLAETERPLSDVVDAVPHPTVVRETVVTPWDQKGAVMRGLIAETTGRRTELVDGIKVFHDDGWVLALPDPEEPRTDLWAEASDHRSAQELLQGYVRRVRRLIR